MSEAIQVLIATGLVLVAALVAYGTVVESRWLELHYLEVPIAGLPAELDGLLIAHLSDLHVGGAIGGSVHRAAVQHCNDSLPDLVVLTGDLSEGGRHNRECINLLSNIHPRPAFAILGNHDYEKGARDADQLVSGIEALGIPVLRNRALRADVRGGSIWVVGVDDPRKAHADTRQALAGLGHQDRPRIFLTHRPDVADTLGEGDADLVLAGHTHGGQIAVPLLTKLLLWKTHTRYSHGLYSVRGTPMYISRGIGATVIPTRFMRRPEVALIKLKATVQSVCAAP